MDDIVRKAGQDEPELLIFGAEAFTSEEYAKAEPENLWRKVWQHACREEDIPEVGDYVAYDICDDTILVVRSAPDRISMSAISRDCSPVSGWDTSSASVATPSLAA